MPTNDPILAEELLTARATHEGLPLVHDALDRFWNMVDRALMQPPASTQRLLFVTAVNEISTNIIKHAYAGGTPGLMRLVLRLYSDRVEALFTDWGVEFKNPQLPDIDPSLEVSELQESGFGLHLARKALDELDYNRAPAGPNSWKLVKFF